MESRDWRYGWAADDPRWTDEPAGASQWGSNGNGQLGPDPRPRHRFGAGPDDGPWDEPESGPLAISGPTPPTAAPTPPTAGAHTPVRPGYGLMAHMNGAREIRVRTTRATRAERPPRPDARVRRRRRSVDDEFRRTTWAEIFGDEPRYLTLFGLTAAWYAAAAVIFFGWMLTVGSASAGSASQPVLTGLPWLLAAVVLSMAVAGLLRWAAVGWRALTLSFAAAVIGAGVATIAHSLAA